MTPWERAPLVTARRSGDAARVTRVVLVVSLQVSDELLSDALYTAPASRVDVLIRTSGETRLSDFMLWQTCGGVLAFRDVLWPVPPPPSSPTPPSLHAFPDRTNSGDSLSSPPVLAFRPRYPRPRPHIQE
jgi:hypothetical protein